MKINVKEIKEALEGYNVVICDEEGDLGDFASEVADVNEDYVIFKNGTQISHNNLYKMLILGTAGIE